MLIPISMKLIKLKIVIFKAPILLSILNKSWEIINNKIGKQISKRKEPKLASPVL
jgi:hypothetical protein